MRRGEKGEQSGVRGWVCAWLVAGLWLVAVAGPVAGSEMDGRVGVCVLRGVGAEESKITGTLLLIGATGGGTNVTVNVKGLGVDKTRGMHLHQNGDVTDRVKGLWTGGHFAAGAGADSAQHGRPDATNPQPHNGDLGNIKGGLVGTGDYSGLTEGPAPNPYVDLGDSSLGVIGRAAVIHELPDQYLRDTDTGNAGGRAAQCVVGIANTQLRYPALTGANLARPSDSLLGIPKFAACEFQRVAPTADSSSSSSGKRAQQQQQQQRRKVAEEPEAANIRGTLQLATLTNGKVRVALRLSGLQAGKRYQVVRREYGDLESFEHLGNTIGSSSLVPSTQQQTVADFSANCVGAAVVDIGGATDGLDGTVMSLSWLLGRGLTVERVDDGAAADADPNGDAGRVPVGACVVGSSEEKYAGTFSVLKPQTRWPQAHCLLQRTQTATSLGFPDLAGEVWVESTDEFDCATRVRITASGLSRPTASSPTPSHGFHIHLYGDLTDAAKGLQTGGHFNPFNALHGLYDGPGSSATSPPPTSNAGYGGDANSTMRHVGDLPMLFPTNGSLTDELLVPSTLDAARALLGNNLVRLSADFSATAASPPSTNAHSVLGRAIVIHAAHDDGSNPVGNSGARLAQCVLGRSDSVPPSAPDQAATLAAPNTRIGPDAAAALIATSPPTTSPLPSAVAVVRPTLPGTSLSTPVEGTIRFAANATTGTVSASVDLRGNPDTLYQLRLLTHGTRRPDSDANILPAATNPDGSSVLFATLAQVGAATETFLADSNGVLRITISPLRGPPSSSGSLTLADTLGRVLAVYPVIQNVVQNPAGAAVVGVANPVPLPDPSVDPANPSPRPFVPPPPEDDSAEESLFDDPLNTGLIAGGIAVGASVLGFASFKTISARRAAAASADPSQSGSSMSAI
eukprot:TRINITY_DN329_c0_g3_i2.p1 TRINITY_DN329_c0_g3~~TRINITY_DN329_c0_g3_i2.p1  ORF type:complete len:910 (-),score=104.60 TRINITY_DN329_c0_g3_i2:115-2844(-)